MTNKKMKTGETSKILDEAVNILKKKGWKITVIGGVNIVKFPSSLKHKYQLVIDFVGVPPEK